MTNINVDVKNNIYGVHATHCCGKHGCKYSKSWCPVLSGEVRQKYKCEECNDELREGGLEFAYLMNEMYDAGHAAGWVDGEHNYKCGCETDGGPGCIG